MEKVLFVCGAPVLRSVLENEGAKVVPSGTMSSAKDLGRIIPEEIFENGRDHTPDRFWDWEHVIFIDCFPPADYPVGTPKTVLRST